jgi:hypothetical protein
LIVCLGADVQLRDGDARLGQVRAQPMPGAATGVHADRALEVLRNRGS